MEKKGKGKEEGKEEEKKLSQGEIKAIIDEYENEYGLSKLFRKQFITLDETIKNEWIQNFAILTIDNKDRLHVGITKNSKEKWKKKEIDEKMKSIANYLYDLRSKFTHEAVQSCSFSMPIERLIGEKKNVLVQIKDDLSLNDMLMVTIISLLHNLLVEDIQKEKKA